MKVAELLELRRRNWSELEHLCDLSRSRSSTKMWLILAMFLFLPVTFIFLIIRLRRGVGRRLNSQEVSRFAALYRAACADLALADSYQLPPNTVQYLHRLVGRAHNQLYGQRKIDPTEWGRMLLFDAPKNIVKDGCFWFAMCLFWGVFLGSAWLAYSGVWYFPPENLSEREQEAWWQSARAEENRDWFAEQILGEGDRETLQESFSTPLDGRPFGDNVAMAGNYIQHNTSIGLQCFVSSLFVIPGILITLFNAAHLGTAFGWMYRQPDCASNFKEFVTAHGPFELTAIVLSAAAGLRIGISAIRTRGFTRVDSITKTARESLPIVLAAVVLFFMAAMIEGFISPSGLPLWFKQFVAIISTLALIGYFLVLGFFVGVLDLARRSDVGT